MKNKSHDWRVEWRLPGDDRVHFEIIEADSREKAEAMLVAAEPMAIFVCVSDPR